MSDRGFITIRRAILDDPVLIDPVCFRAWIWLLAEAAWKPRRVTVTTGRSKVAIELERGQLSYSLKYLAKAWDIGVQRVRTILRKFEEAGMIHIRTGNQADTHSNTQSTRKSGTLSNTRTGQLPMLITIRDYNHIQWIQDNDSALGNTQTNIHGNDETNDKHKNKQLEDSISGPSGPAEVAARWPANAFSQWYALYPRKKQRKAAETAFAKLQRSGEIDFQGLLSVTRRHVVAMKTVETRFIPYPSTWLNTGSYLDEDDKPQMQQSIAPPERYA
jgi:hypothetical protein